MVDWSSVPLNLSGCRLVESTLGACTSEYAVVASLPAYLRMTDALVSSDSCILCVGLCQRTGRTARMFLQEIGDIPHLTVDDDPTVVGGLVLGDLPGRQASLCHCDDTSGENILCACQKSKYPGDASPPRSCPRTLGWCDRDALCAGVPAVDAGSSALPIEMARGNRLHQSTGEATETDRDR